MKKPFLIILFISIISIANAQTYDTLTAKTNDTTLYLSVDQQPEFPGGYSALLAYVGRDVMKNARGYGQNIHGKIFIQMIVENNGTPSHVKVIRGFSKEVDEGIVKAIEKCPKWIPGIKDGKNVRTFLTFPLNLSVNPAPTQINVFINTKKDTTKK